MRDESGRSWVVEANEAECGAPLTHLPYGAFRDGSRQRLCVAIGKRVLELGRVSGFRGEIAGALREDTLNALFSLGRGAWSEVRLQLMEILGAGASAEVRAEAEGALRAREDVQLTLPIEVQGYTDFYASIEHARRVGEIFRPDQPLLPNYRHVPIAYNGRASSMVVSGTAVRRPWGQTRPAADAAEPGFGPTRALDYEVELGLVVGTGNELGDPVPVEEAEAKVFGVTLLNDWSARDVQAWEYQPLGPFLGKSFATTISGWITPMEALEPFRERARERGEGEPGVLPYLREAAGRALGVKVEVWLRTAKMRAEGEKEFRLSEANADGLYWTAAQMVAHHTSNGCNLRAGDVLGTGTISGAEESAAGCLLELTRNGTKPVDLPSGESRRWLEDGDEVTLRATASRAGERTIRLGECRGEVVGAMGAKRDAVR